MLESEGKMLLFLPKKLFVFSLHCTAELIFCVFFCVLFCSFLKVKVKVKVSAAYMSQTRDQQRFTISEVAADWHFLCLCFCALYFVALLVIMGARSA